MNQKVTLGIIEDDADTLLTLQQMAADLELEIAFAETTPQKIVGKIAETEATILIIALHLATYVDGLQGVWPLEAGEDLPVIYLATPAEEVLLEPSAVSGYLLKPFSQKQLPFPAH